MNKRATSFLIARLALTDDAGTCDFFLGKEPKNRAKLLISANIRPNFRLNVVFFVILQSFREYNKNHYNERFLQMA
uniref:hypothetical protein n=1 Tax=Prevotella sp. TaxID=59823 RepID=UPI00402592A7